MSVKVTLEFKNADEAIVALGKLVGIRTSKNANIAVEAGTDSRVGSGAVGAQAGVTESGSATSAGPSTVPPVAPATRTRKPRADKGQKRGEYKPRAENAEDGTNAPAMSPEKSGNAPTTVPDPSKAAEKAANSKSTPVAAPAAATTVPSAPDVAPVPVTGEAPSEGVVQAAVEKLYGEKGYDTTLAALSRYGVKRGKDLPAEQRANFIADVDRILAGGAV